jgi:hypothetical protein
MPTATEQKALAFVAIVILLGGAARVVRAGALAPPTPTSAEEQALARQAFAANSSAFDRRSAKAEKRQKVPRMSLKRRYDGAQTIAGVAGVPLSDVRPGAPEWRSPATRTPFRSGGIASRPTGRSRSHRPGHGGGDRDRGSPSDRPGTGQTDRGQPGLAWSLWFSVRVAAGSGDWRRHHRPSGYARHLLQPDASLGRLRPRRRRPAAVPERRVRL